MVKCCVRFWAASLLIFMFACSGMHLDASALHAEAEEAETITISFVGDCSIGDSLKQRGLSSSLTSQVKEHGFDWLFETVRPYFEADDLTVANLEVVLSDYNEPKYPLKTYNLIAPSEHREILSCSGIDAVNTVNNHCVDFNYKGYRDTLQNLEEAGILHFGSLNATRDTNRFVDHVIHEIKGVTFGFMGYSYPSNSDLKLIQGEIQELRDAGCDIVVVSLHWGKETKPNPQANQFNYAQKVLDAGADMIWGHHPHVLQPVYFYNGKPVLFSTGNFVFGTISKLDPATGIFQLTWEKTGDGARLASLSMIPCQTQRGGEYQPIVLEDADDKENCLKHVIGKAKKGFVELPEGFEKTGTVYIDSEGNLEIGE